MIIMTVKDTVMMAWGEQDDDDDDDDADDKEDSYDNNAGEGYCDDGVGGAR